MFTKMQFLKTISHQHQCSGIIICKQFINTITIQKYLRPSILTVLCQPSRVSPLYAPSPKLQASPSLTDLSETALSSAPVFLSLKLPLFLKYTFETNLAMHCRNKQSQSRQQPGWQVLAGLQAAQQKLLY